MKRFYLFKLIILIALLLGSNERIFAQASTFTYTGSGPQYYTVPAGVTSVSIDASGASGGNSNFGYGSPGKGGRVRCNLAVTGGQVLNVYVGGQGGSLSGSYGSNAPGGYNGGGLSGIYYYPTAGGGMSDVRTGGTAFPSNAVVVAGGGGGVGSLYSNCNGGDGGGLTGKSGQWNGSSSCACYCPTGGTQTGPGNNGTCSGGTASQPTGGTGNIYGGGGGGGYYGGGGGYYYGGGAGGSSYPAAGGGNISGLTHTQGYNSGNGVVVICPGPIVGNIIGSHFVCPSGVTTQMSDVGGVTGGVWSSSKPSVAAVGGSTGIVTGILPGTATISYTVTSACTSGSAVYTMTVLSGPTIYNELTSAPSYCVGGVGVDVATDGSDVGTTYQLMLNGSLVTGASKSGTGSAIDFGNRTVTGTNGTFSIQATSASGCIVTLAGSTLIYTTPLPNVYPVSSTAGAFCAGGIAPHITLSTSDVGVNYQLFYNSTPVAGPTMPVAGTGSLLDFGAQTLGGTYTVSASNATTTCSVNMTGSPVITVNPLPTQYTVTSVGTSYCATGAGVPISLSNSKTGIRYQLFLGAMAIGGPINGTTGSVINFGSQTGAGLYTVQATDNTTLCTQNMTGSINVAINPLPNVYTVTGGGSYCASGTGLHVGLSSSDIGINYQLLVGGAPTGLPKAGTGSALDFGIKTAAGSYTVQATNAATGCQNYMAGSVSVAVNPLPTVYTVSAPGGVSSYCQGGAGVHINLSFSDVGVTYQLYMGSALVGTPIAGTGSPIDFGAQLAPGNYTVQATNTTTTCTNNMGGSVTISINLLPTLHTVTGGGNYCSGGSGLPVGLNGSNPGILYQLYNASAPVGTPVAGTGSSITFGLQTLSGTFTVAGTNTITGCSNTMTSSANIIVKPLPTSYLVTGGGGYCAGAAGSDIALSGSDAGISYQLYNGSTTVGGAILGSGSAGIDFGNQTVVGTYTVKAIDNVTTCSTIMPGTATISIDPLPTVYSVYGGGTFCTGGMGADVSMSYSNIGINYQLYAGTNPVGGLVPGTGATLDFGLQTTTGIYTVKAINAANGCSLNMTGSANVTSTAPPAAYPVNVTGGGHYCAGGTGVDITLGSSNTGNLYQLYNGLTPVGLAKIGSGSTIDFGMKTVSGTYTVVATNAVTGCTMNMTGSATVVIDALPNAYSVTGGGSYCKNGTGPNVMLSNSDNGVTYQLYVGSFAVPFGNQTGSAGTSINFGSQGAAGSYTVIATDGTTGCSSNMSGSAAVAILPLPGLYTVTGGGNYCVGGTGVHINLDGSSKGISYQLSNGSPVGAAVTGTGSALDFGLQTTTGTYSVSATDNTTGCTDNMMSSVPVGTNPLPDIDTVTGSGHYCSGSTGVSVGLNASSSTVNYQLVLGGLTNVGSPVKGTGSLLNFGPQTAGGYYTVVATDATTMCSSNMASSALVTIDPLVTPFVTISAPSTTVCASSTVNYTTTIANGGSAPMYQWSVNGSPISGETNSTYSGTPSNLDIVSVALTSNANCASPTTVNNEVTMTVNPATTPAVSIMADPGNSVCPGTPVTFTAVASNAGTAPTYSWMQNSNPAGTNVFTTLTPSNGDAINVTITSSDPCATTTTATNSLNMTVTPPVKPTNVALTVTPGKNIIAGQLDTVMVKFNTAGTNPTFEWEINGVVIPGETSNMLIRDNFNNHDSITCIVTGDGICGGISVGASASILVRITTGVNQVTGLGSDIRVVPNPNKGAFAIKGSLGTTDDQQVSLEISNMLGQVVYSNNVTAHNGIINEPVQLSNTMANGMYLLTVRSGSENTTFHFVIEQ